MRKLTLALLSSAAAFVLVGGAQAADLPTKKTPPAPPAANCYASFYSWLDSTAADCPLTYMGVTVYGVIDLGAGYESHAAAFNGPNANGVSELISKANKNAAWQWVPSGLSSTTVGIKFKETFAPGWSIVGDVNTGFNPYSFQLDNGAKTLLQNSSTVSALQGTQSANGDSSRAGQWDNTRGYLGISNTTFGTLTAGRQYAFSNDMSGNYDSMGGAYAFSLLQAGGYVGGLGATEASRVNTSVKYQFAYNGFRAGALTQVGNYSQGNGAENEYQFDLGGDYGGFSADAIYSYARDVVNLGVDSHFSTALPYLKATIANISAEAVAVKYTTGPWKLFAGYMYAKYSNPTDSYAADAQLNGFTNIGGYSEPGGQGQNFIVTNAYINNKILQGAWLGAKYALRSDIDLMGAYYWEGQNDYNTKTCTGSGVATSASSCAGNLQAVSGVIDWRPVKRLDVYGGVMYSAAAGGMASGYSNTNNIATTVGVRLNF